MSHELPWPAVTALNVCGLPALQLGLAWLFPRLPAAWFDGAAKPASVSRDFFRVRKWKAALPDGGAWFAGGFAKARLASRDPAYLRHFVRETRRGEACHWVALLLCGVFFLWNPWWGDLVIGLYAVAANVPCILAQRYNRARLLHALRRSK